MTKKLWEASLHEKKNSILYQYEKFISKQFNKKFYLKYQHILEWSIKNSDDFWSSIWDFSGIIGIKNKKKLKNQKFFIKIFFYQGQN